MLTDKQASLIKKAIRMVDYMRADLVAILGEQPEPNRLQDARMSPEVAAMLDPISGQPLPVGSPYSMAHLPKAAACAHQDAQLYGTGVVRVEDGEAVHVPAGSIEIATPVPGAHFPLYGAAVIHSTLFAVMADVEARYPMKDGPAVAYFHLAPSGAISIEHPVGTRHDYDTVRTREYGSPEGAVAAYQAVLHDYLHPKVGTIYWRTRPTLDQSVTTGRYSVFSRLVVIA